MCAAAHDNGGAAVVFVFLFYSTIKFARLSWVEYNQLFSDCMHCRA